MYIKLKINLKQKERSVGWAGVRSVVSAHCSLLKHDNLVFGQKIRRTYDNLGLEWKDNKSILKDGT